LIIFLSKNQIINNNNNKSFSKELGITLLGILAACEVFNIIQRGIDLKKKSLHKEGIYSLIRIGLFIALGVGYILMRKWFIGEAVSVGHEVFKFFFFFFF